MLLNSNLYNSASELYPSVLISNTLVRIHIGYSLLNSTELVDYIDKI